MQTSTGALTPGVHGPADWAEFESRFGFNQHRRKLLAGLKTALYLLAEAGCAVVYVNGSFVTSKEFPGDIDACWETNGVDWDRLAPIFTDFADQRAAQKARFGCEFFPADWRADHTGKRDRPAGPGASAMNRENHDPQPEAVQNHPRPCREV